MLASSFTTARDVLWFYARIKAIAVFSVRLEPFLVLPFRKPEPMAVWLAARRIALTAVI